VSDFLFSSSLKPNGELTHHIHTVYHQDPPEVKEFHGRWGSVAVSRNLYNGFQPLETQEHIFVIIGGPVLCFADNGFLTGNNLTEGTQRIYDRYTQGYMAWDEDLSGPFAVLIIEKDTGEIICVTDLMMFIPVYKYEEKGTVMLGTHVDCLAMAADQCAAIDRVSLADFVLNNVITYPFTAYRNVRQIHPAAVHSFKPFDGGLREDERRVYWVPNEVNSYTNIQQASMALRSALHDYIGSVTESMTEVAHFISGGEDSRAVAGLIPARLKRHAFIFLDNMNREGEIAQRVAKAYGADFHTGFRGETHYLDILPQASDLIGSGHQYLHAHSLGFHKSCGLDQYMAVFGGYLSDSLLKALYARKRRGHGRFPFLPEFFLPGEPPSRPAEEEGFSEDTVKAIEKRRKAHLEAVQEFRKQSSHEWFVLWPATMRVAMPNLYSNRRLFRTYEPFMCKEAVKISAAVPTNWKLNRRLFNRAMRPALRPSRWLLHAKGWLPYFPWWFNMPVHCCVWASRLIAKGMGVRKGHQGPWGDWEMVMKSDAWKKWVERYTSGEETLDDFFKKSAEVLLKNSDSEPVDWYRIPKQSNLLQVLYSMEKMRKTR
jgi:hypothetical protein